MIKEGLEWEYKNNYNSDKKITSNWWDFEIGVPRAISNTFVILYEYFDKETISRYTDSIYHFVPNNNQFRVTIGNPLPTKGGNLIDMGRGKMIAAFLREDNTILKYQHLYLRIVLIKLLKTEIV